MKKIPFLMLLVCLSLVTAAVFAMGKRALNAGLVAKEATGSIYHQISEEPSLTSPEIQTTTAGNEMKVTNSSGTPLSVFFYDGASTYTPVRASGW